MASWCCITSSGAKKLCPIGSCSGCCPRADPAARNTSAQAQRTLEFISFLLIRLHGNVQVRLAESRRCPQNLPPWSFQQYIAGCSPFRQLFGGGQLGLWHSPYRSPVQRQTNH